MFTIKYPAGSHCIVPLPPFLLLEHATHTSSLWHADTETCEIMLPCAIELLLEVTANRQN